MQMILLGDGATNLAELFLRLDWEFDPDVIHDEDYDLAALLELITDIAAITKDTRFLATDDIREI